MFPPSAMRQSPTGEELDAIDFVAIAIPSLRSLRLSHIKRRRLIMPLVALVQKNRAHQRLRTNTGARHSLPRRRCSSRSVFEEVSACLRTLFRVIHLNIAFLGECKKKQSANIRQLKQNKTHLSRCVF